MIILAPLLCWRFLLRQNRLDGRLCQSYHTQRYRHSTDMVEPDILQGTPNKCVILKLLAVCDTFGSNLLYHNTLYRTHIYTYAIHTAKSMRNSNIAEVNQGEIHYVYMRFHTNTIQNKEQTSSVNLEFASSTFYRLYIVLIHPAN